jgi:hypothetical protein
VFWALRTGHLTSLTGPIVGWAPLLDEGGEAQRAEGLHRGHLTESEAAGVSLPSKLFSPRHSAATSHLGFSLPNCE